MTTLKTIIIGAGASGLFASALLGKEALVLEANEREGKKLLLTGGGRCNYTNLSSEEEIISHFHTSQAFIRPAIYNLPPQKIIEFFSSLGVKPLNEEGKIFPITERSEDVISALRKRANIALSAKVSSIRRESDHFIISTANGLYSAENVIVATGCNAYPQTGSDGNGYELVKSLGHTITPLSPALAPIILTPAIQADGITLPLTIKLDKREYSGSAVITKRGISGPLAENISYLLNRQRDVKISFLNELSLRDSSPKKLVRNAIPLPPRLLSALLKGREEIRLGDLSKRDEIAIIETITSSTFTAIADRRGAMSTHGGIPLSEIDKKTMMSRLVPSLYLVGDVVDVDGDCGGYSLTWAFASASLAVKAIRAKD